MYNPLQIHSAYLNAISKSRPYAKEIHQVKIKLQTYAKKLAFVCFPWQASFYHHVKISIPIRIKGRFK